MTKRAIKVVTDSETLQALADLHGEDQLLEDMMSSGLSYYTARDMIRGTYGKALRGTTQNALFDSLKKHGVTRERLFKRAATREKRTA